MNPTSTKFQDFKGQNLSKILTELKKNNTRWEDPLFPSTQASIGELMKGQIKWKKGAELMKKPQLVSGGISPEDIVQGGLGDCYFLSALSILAEYPERVKKIFALDEIQNGVFAANIFLDGIPTCVMVDDRIPCIINKNIPAFSRNKGEELWVLMLEKVYAKCYGSYETIEGGVVGDALSDLTGAPYNTFRTQGTTATPIDELWKILVKADKATYLMAAAVPDTPGVDLEKLLGLVEGHAYAILDLKEAQGVRLIQIRNPWGDDMEWNGDYSDQSPLWTESLKKDVGWKKADDGTFWMSFNDFYKYYNDIIVVYYNDNHSPSSSWEGELAAAKSTTFKVTVQDNTTFRILFNQVRGVDPIHLKLNVLDSKGANVGSSGKALSSAEVITTSELVLAAGTYSLVVDVYSKDVEKLPRKFTISSYGTKPVVFSK